MPVLDPRLLFADFAALIGLPELELDDDGRVAVAFDDVVLLVEAEQDGRFLVSAAVAELPDRVDDRYLRRLMEANYAAAVLGRGTLGVEPTSGTVTYLDRIASTGSDGPAFAKAIGDRVDAIVEWRRLFHDDTLPVETDAAAPLAEGDHFIRV